MSSTFAIVIPVYNGANFLAESIDSALAQARPADEIVILDDASTDDTPEIIDRYAQQVGERLHTVRLTQRVPAAEAWNQAVLKSAADYVVILAHDDLLHPDFLEHAESVIRETPNIDLFICGVEIIDEKGVRQRSNLISGTNFEVPGLVSNRAFLDRFTSNGQFFLPSATLLKRLLFDRLGGFDPKIRVAYDWEFYLRAGTCASIYLSDLALASYRIHSSQSIAMHTRKDNGDSDVIFDKLPRIGEQFTRLQRTMLVQNMCDFLRRFATRVIMDSSISEDEVVSTRRGIADRLESWRSGNSPYAQYVSVRPGHWRQKLMWACAGNARFVKVARLLLAMRLSR